MKAQIAFILTLIFIVCKTNAQLKVYPNGNVGIGTTSADSKMSINGIGSTSTTFMAYHTNDINGQGIYGYTTGSSTNKWKYGLFGFTTIAGNGLSFGVTGCSYSSTPLSYGRAYGVKGQAGNASDGYNFSIYGQLIGTRSGTAIFGMIPGYYEDDIIGQYAGYFKGPVHITEQLSIEYSSYEYAIDVDGAIRASEFSVLSDGRLKQNIQNMNGALSLIGKLQGVTYTLNPAGKDALKTKAIISNTSDTSINVTPKKVNRMDNPLYTKKHIGFVAQDIQKIFPDLVYEDKDGILSVDYTSLIPVLVESVKEQQSQVMMLIEELKALKLENEKLKKKVGIQ